jgi:hypothetical protein
MVVGPREGEKAMRGSQISFNIAQVCEMVFLSSEVSSAGDVDGFLEIRRRKIVAYMTHILTWAEPLATSHEYEVAMWSRRVAVIAAAVVNSASTSAFL